MEQITDANNKKMYKAYPDVEFQSQIISCLSMRIDNQNRLWLLDFANMAITETPKFFVWQLSNNENEKDVFLFEYSFPPNMAGLGSMLNDFNISPNGKYVYIADTSILASQPALVIFDVDTKTSYRLLNGHKSMYGLSPFLNINNGEPLSIFKYLGLKINVDSIVLSRDGNALYYGALTGDTMYCIDTSYLTNYIVTMQRENINRSNKRNSFKNSIAIVTDLTNNIHTVLEDKPATDGLTNDDIGNIYMTALEYSSIAIARPLKHMLYNIDKEGKLFLVIVVL